MASLVGKNLGKYQLAERIGKGGMAEVYKAHHPKLDRDVTIKILYSHLVEGEDFTARFEREARAVASLRHPHIIQIHDFDIENETYYMVMEYVDGGTLQTRMAESAGAGAYMPIGQVLQIMGEVAQALDYAHGKGIIHRDVKPSNILLNSAGTAFLADFGIARMVSGTQFTMTGALIGTPAYMSPEQAQGMELTPASDVYSFGVVLYELLTGRAPFIADTPLAVIQKHITEKVPRPQSIRRDLPEAMERVMAGALAKEPERRYEHAVDLCNDLRSTLTPERIAALDAGRTQVDAAEPVLPTPAAGREPPGGGHVLSEIRQAIDLIHDLEKSLSAEPTSGGEPGVTETGPSAAALGGASVGAAAPGSAPPHDARTEAAGRETVGGAAESGKPARGAPEPLIRAAEAKRPAPKKEKRRAPVGAEPAHVPVEPAPQGRVGRAGMFARPGSRLAIAAAAVVVTGVAIVVLAGLPSPAPEPGLCLTIDECTNQADSLDRSGDLNAALVRMDTAISLAAGEEHPLYAYLWCHRADLASKAGQLEAAASDYDQCAAWAEDRPELQGLRDRAALGKAAAVEHQSAENQAGTTAPTLAPRTVAAPVAVQPTSLPGNVVVALDSLGTGIPWLPLDDTAKPEVHYVSFNVLRPPFNNALVRAAFAQALGREELTDIAVAHQLEVEDGPTNGLPAATLTPPQTLGRNLRGAVGLAFNPERAAALMQEAGFAKPSSFRPATLLIVPYAETGDARMEMANAMAEMWQTNLGVQVQVQTVDTWDQFIERVRYDPPDMYWWGWTAEKNDPDDFLWVLFRYQAGGRNWGNFLNAEFNSLVDRARTTHDPGERQALYIQAERILCEIEVGAIPIYHSTTPWSW